MYHKDVELIFGRSFFSMEGKRASPLHLSFTVTISAFGVEHLTPKQLHRSQHELIKLNQLAHPKLATSLFSTRFKDLSVDWQVQISCADLMRQARPGGFEETIAMAILRDSARGLNYLHRHGMVHGHLQCSSILIDSKSCVRLGCMQPASHTLKQRRNSPRLAWTAPEVIVQAGGVSAAADVWSLGVTAIELAQGVTRLVGVPSLKVMLQVLRRQMPQHVVEASAILREVANACLQLSPCTRPSMQSLLVGPLFAALSDSAAQKALAPIMETLQISVESAVVPSEDPRKVLLARPVTRSSAHEASADHILRRMGMQCADVLICTSNSSAPLVTRLQPVNARDLGLDSSNVVNGVSSVHTGAMAYRNSSGAAAWRPSVDLGGMVLGAVEAGVAASRVVVFAACTQASRKPASGLQETAADLKAVHAVHAHVTAEKEIGLDAKQPFACHLLLAERTRMEDVQAVIAQPVSGL